MLLITLICMIVATVRTVSSVWIVCTVATVATTVTDWIKPAEMLTGPDTIALTVCEAPSHTTGPVTPESAVVERPTMYTPTPLAAEPGFVTKVERPTTETICVPRIVLTTLMTPVFKDTWTVPSSVPTVLTIDLTSDTGSVP